MKQEKDQLINEPIKWQGDLDDDCTAIWEGLMLRAEWMDEDHWWWAVYDMEKDEMVVDASYEHKIEVIGGENARNSAEKAARKYLGEKTADNKNIK